MEKKNNRLPQGWEWARIGDVFKTYSGGTPDTSQKDYWKDGTIPWINSGALNDDTIEQPTTFISESGYLNSSARLFPINTVVIALTGSTLGKLGILNFECSTNQSVTGILPSRYVLPRFIYYYLLSIRKSIVNSAKGSAQPHINKKILDDISIPICPISQQNEIVSYLDDLNSLSKNIKKKADDLLFLQSAAFNDLIYDNDELYSTVLLGEYCIERSERVGESWQGKRLIGVSKDFGVTDLRSSGNTNFSKYKLVYNGDFLYNPMRINIGSIAIYEGKEIALTSPDYIVFKVHRLLSPLLLLHFLKSNIGSAEINKYTQGSVRSRLYFSKLSKIDFPFSGANGQVEAQSIMESFQKMIDESKRIIDYLSTVFNKALYVAFNKMTFKDAVNQNSGGELIELLRLETKEQMKKKSSNRSPKASEQKKKKSLIEIIESENVITTEALWTESIYFESRDVEGFYRELLFLKDKKIVNSQFDEDKMYTNFSLSNEN